MPSFSFFFFLLSSQLSRRTRAETLAAQAQVTMTVRALSTVTFVYIAFLLAILTHVPQHRISLSLIACFAIL